MSFYNLATKFNSLFSGATLMRLSSLVATSAETQQTVEINNLGAETVSIITKVLVNFILKIVYYICSFVLNIIEFFQYIVSSLLGIGMDIEDFVVIDTTNPLIKFLTSDAVTKTFKLVLGVSIVLVIIFAIFAIVRSEYQFIVDGDEEANSKERILARVLRSIFIMGSFPMITLACIILINAILAGFNDILRGGQNTTIAGQIFISSAYNANNYRNYADGDVRIPILIDFDDPYTLGQAGAYDTETLAGFYKEFQPKGKALYNNYYTKSFPSFSDTLDYKNNRVVNKSNYRGYEKFVCTKEQYYVMADFIDYAVKNNITYYVKNMNDVDISWKYVNKTIYDAENHSLTITYKNASNPDDGKTYSVVYAPSTLEISTPISDALKSISAILAIGDYSNYTFNALDRAEDSINVVEWGTQKAYLKLSKDFADSYSSGSALNMTSPVDQLILFENARFKYNNDLDFKISELIKGVEVPVYKLDKRVYQKSSNTFITTSTHYCIKINGTYYEVFRNPDLVDDSGNLLADEYGNAYYSLPESAFLLDEKTKTELSNPEYSEEVKQNYIQIANSNQYLYKNSDSFKDIILTKVNKTEVVNVDGKEIYTTYDDVLTEVIRQVSWPQKLINDLQVIYSDININNLITTGKWLENLGEYVTGLENSGQVEGEGEGVASPISTSLITPLGLLMSELFLSEIDTDNEDNTYASISFSSKYDESTMKALILSVLGEENYFQLQSEIKYFMEIFNAFMAPVLDELAYYESFDLVEGNAASQQLYTYKAYLASMMLSESMSKWMKETAFGLLGVSSFSQDIQADHDVYDKYGKKVLDAGAYFSYAQLQTISKEADNDVGSCTYVYKVGTSTVYEKIELTQVYYNDEKHTSYLEKLYNANKELLANQDVEEGDDGYPEYMIAIRDYMKGDNTAFNGRLESILKGTETKDQEEFKVNEKYANLVTAYNLLPETYVYDGYYKTVKALFHDIATFKDADTAEILNKLRNECIQASSSLKAEIGGNEIDEVNKYIQAVYDYTSAKIKFLEEDTTYKKVGEREKLQKDADKYIRHLNNWHGILNPLVEINELDSNLKPIRSKINEIHALLESNPTGDNWEELKELHSELQAAVDSLTFWNNVDNLVKFVAMQRYAKVLGKYIDTQETIDKLDRYYLTFGVNSMVREDTELELTVVVNSKHYVVGNNFTDAMFIEYVLGAEVLESYGFDNVFVPDGYTGLVDQYATGYDSFSRLKRFIVELGDLSATLYQMTNMVNLSVSSIDQIKIGSETEEGGIDLSKAILDFILNNQYLSEDLIRAFFGLTIKEIEGSTGGVVSDEEKLSNAVKAALAAINKYTAAQKQEKLNVVLSYLLLTEDSIGKEGYIDYSELTLKELRLKCLDFLSNYEDQKGESVEQNQRRFLAVFALLTADWCDANGIGATDNNWAGSDREKIKDIKTHKQTQATILRMAGLDNRPTSELVNAEYSIDFNTKYPDEQNGDVFVICTLDEETKLYVPFMMSNKRNPDLTCLEVVEEENWYTKFGYRSSYSEYYATEGEKGYNVESAFFPVIAKGVVTADGYPTAIREVDGEIEYYREQIVIRDSSNIGLEQYFASVDQIPVNHTGLSMAVNFITELFTGETLIEKVAKSNPRVVVNSDVYLCYGVDDLLEARSQAGKVAMSFNFDSKSCLDMEFFYSQENMNVVILLVGITSMIFALWHAVWGCVSRIYEITLLYILGPAAVSTIVLKTDSRDKDKNVVEGGNVKIYDTWKESLISKLLEVFAYAVGFNAYFIIAPIISDLVLFENLDAFRHIPFKNLIDINFINQIARLIFLAASARLTTKAVDIFTSISGTENGFKKGQETFANVKNTMNQVKDLASGQKFMDDLGNAVDMAKGLIPGAELAKPLVGGVKALSRNVQAASARHKLIKQGVDPAVADKMASELKTQLKERDQFKQEQKEIRRIERASRDAKRDNNEGKAKKLKEQAKKKASGLKEQRKKSAERKSKYKNS